MYKHLAIDRNIREKFDYVVLVVSFFWLIAEKGSRVIVMF